MQFLKALFSRAIAIGFEGHRRTGKLTDSGMLQVHTEDHKKTFVDLDSREKEMLLNKIVGLLDGQLEVSL